MDDSGPYLSVGGCPAPLLPFHPNALPSAHHNCLDQSLMKHDNFDLLLLTTTLFWLLLCITVMTSHESWYHHASLGSANDQNTFLLSIAFIGPYGL